MATKWLSYINHLFCFYWIKILFAAPADPVRGIKTYRHTYIHIYIYIIIYIALEK